MRLSKHKTLNIHTFPSSQTHALKCHPPLLLTPSQHPHLPPPTSKTPPTHLAKKSTTSTLLAQNNYPSIALSPSHPTSNPPFCQTPYSSPDLTRITASTHRSPSYRYACALIHTRAGYVHLLVVDAYAGADRVNASMAAGHAVVGKIRGRVLLV